MDQTLEISSHRCSMKATHQTGRETSQTPTATRRLGEFPQLSKRSTKVTIFLLTCFSVSHLHLEFSPKLNLNCIFIFFSAYPFSSQVFLLRFTPSKTIRRTDANAAMDGRSNCSSRPASSSTSPRRKDSSLQAGETGEGGLVFGCFAIQQDCKYCRISSKPQGSKWKHNQFHQ